MEFKKPKGEPERWITVNGQHIPVYKGQSNTDAIYWYHQGPKEKQKDRVDHDEDKKEKQIEANKKEADKLNAENEKSSLGKKTVIKDLSEYKGATEYGKELVGVVQDFSTPVYQIEHNGGKAFVDLSEGKSEYHIEMMASTGKGAGTEILARAAEKAHKAGASLTWSADVNSAIKYYSHIGADKYAQSTFYGKSYSVSAKELPAFIGMLRKKKG